MHRLVARIWLRPGGGGGGGGFQGPKVNPTHSEGPLIIRGPLTVGRVPDIHRPLIVGRGPDIQKGH